MTVINTEAQHIQYRDKKKPVAKQPDGGTAQAQTAPLPDKTIVTTPPHVDTVPKPVVAEKKVEIPLKKVIPVDTASKPVAKLDTGSARISKAAFTLNPRPRKPWIEEQNVCNLLSKPELAPQLPLIINNVKPEMVKLIKERYKGRLYSITGLNMMDERLKYKLKICDKDNAKFRSEYLDKDGNVVKDPGLYYD
jgi:hypothetical protein